MKCRAVLRKGCKSTYDIIVTDIESGEMGVIADIAKLNGVECDPIGGRIQYNSIEGGIIFYKLDHECSKRVMDHLRELENKVTTEHYGIRTCKQCFHRWIAETAEPKCCPKCKSYNWKYDSGRYGSSWDWICSTDPGNMPGQTETKSMRDPTRREPMRRHGGVG